MCVSALSNSFFQIYEAIVKSYRMVKFKKSVYLVVWTGVNNKGTGDLFVFFVIFQCICDV